VALVFCHRPAKADAPTELYHVNRSSISVSVLRDSIGILTINSGNRKGRFLHTYKLMAGKFAPDKGIAALKTTPVSNFGYHPSANSEEVASYRYPIVRKEADFIEIAIDPVSPTLVWINSRDLDREFITEADYFDDFRPKEGLIDSSFFAPNTKIFKEPSLSSESSDPPQNSFYHFSDKRTDSLKSGKMQKTTGRKKSCRQGGCRSETRKAS
jgi:hypothetical protein